MHNRVRMIVGSYLVKNLNIDWRHGKEWFWDCLLDADLATLATYYQADEGKIRNLSLRLVSLREKVGVARKELQEAATRSRMAHLALDKNAEEFREAHAARQEVALNSFLSFMINHFLPHRLSASGKQVSKQVQAL